MDHFNGINSICVTTVSNPKFKLKPDYDYAVRKVRGGMIELVGDGIDDKASHKIGLDDLFVNFVEMNVSKAERNCTNGD